MERTNDMFIHEIENWTSFRWNAVRLSELIARTNKAIGYLAGRLSTIGFDNQMAATVEAVTHDVVSSSEIEGITLNTAEVRSSVARKLGVAVPDTKEPTHYIDGVVEMMLDAVMNYDTPLNHDRLFGWHAALFPTGKSGFSDIMVELTAMSLWRLYQEHLGGKESIIVRRNRNVCLMKWINSLYGLMIKVLFHH